MATIKKTNLEDKQVAIVQTEVSPVVAKAKAIVGSRIRYKLDEFGLTPKMLLTCNPARN